MSLSLLLLHESRPQLITPTRNLQHYIYQEYITPYVLLHLHTRHVTGSRCFMKILVLIRAHFQILACA